MEKDRRTRKGGPVALLVFIACFLLFNWPLLSIPAEKGGLPTIVYLFLSWLLLIFCLFRYCRNEAAGPPEHPGKEGRS